MRATTATINLKAIQHNYLVAKKLLPQAKAIAVIKANAYGHGAIKVATSLNKLADMFAVACSEEALELRNSGINKPILLLEGLFAQSELAIAVKHNLSMVVATPRQVKWLEKQKNRLKIFLKYDTGMHRLGFNQANIKEALNKLSKHDITLMTHFANADEPNCSYTKQQIDIFNHLVKPLKNKTSLSNSAAIMRQIEPNQDYIRPGIMLYGSAPIKQYQDKLIPAMTLTAPIIAINRLKQGDKIGYGSSYSCNKDSLIATVAIGYADGYPRHAPNGTKVLVNGKKCNLVGRVSMDMITIDISSVKQVKLDDKVELFGENIKADDLAASAGTISYEIFTKISKRVIFDYKSQ